MLTVFVTFMIGLFAAAWLWIFGAAIAEAVIELWTR